MMTYLIAMYVYESPELLKRIAVSRENPVDVMVTPVAVAPE
jgi:hypothetical protein